MIRMKAVVLRRSLTGGKATWTVVGGVVGLALAVVTLGLGLSFPGEPRLAGDLLAAAFLMWTLGWVVGPVVGGAPVLRPEQFALLAVPRGRLAVGLLASAFVGVTTAVTLVAFAGLVGYAARLGVLPALVAVVAAAGQLVLAVLLSRVAAALFAAVARSRTGAGIVGLIFGVMLTLAQSGWMLIVAINVSGVLTGGLPAGLSAAMRAAPSGWGVVAVEAAARGEWAVVAGALGGLLLLILALLFGWSRTLDGSRTIRVTVRGSAGAAPARGGIFAGRTGGVLRKELRTWARDPVRIQNIVAPVAVAVGTALLPLTFGSKDLLPWAAPLLAVLAAATASNLYAQDGTALWLTLLTGTERADVRGRQWAFLLVFGPITLAVAVAFTAWSGLGWAWPWVFALTPAMLGGGAGLMALVSVTVPAPGPDAHRRSDDPLEHGDTAGQANLTFWAGLLPGLPPAGVVLAGVLTGNDLLLWAGVPVGIGTGVLLAWGFGRLAWRRLAGYGGELLFLFRTGRPEGSKAGAAKGGNALVGVYWTLGAIALLPQGIMPVVVKLGDLGFRSWFLALYVPGPLQWPVAIAMIVIGCLFCHRAIKLSRTPLPKTGEPAEPMKTAAGRG